MFSAMNRSRLSSLLLLLLLLLPSLLISSFFTYFFLLHEARYSALGAAKARPARHCSSHIPRICVLGDHWRGGPGRVHHWAKASFGFSGAAAASVGSRSFRG
jgi:hypothetical protein